MFRIHQTNAAMAGRGRGKKTKKQPARDKRTPARFGDDDTNGGPTKKAKRSLSLGQAVIEEGELPDSDFDSDNDIDLSVGQEHEVELSLEDQIKKMVGVAVSAAIPELVKQVVAATATTSSRTEAAGANPRPGTSAQTAVQAAVQNQTDVISVGNVSLPSLPLDLHLTADIKAKILGNKYVKFGQLLYRDASDHDKLTVQVNNTQIEGQHLTVNPYPQQVKIKDIAAWDRAFSIYCYTYFSRHGDQAQGLTQYGRLIKDMAWRGLQWAIYDQNFRRLRELNADSYPWGKIEPHLWSQCATPHPNSFNGPTQSENINNLSRSSTQSRGANFRPSSANQESANKCFRFNRGQYCAQPCNYEHTCSNCGGQHTAASCTLQPAADVASDEEGFIGSDGQSYAETLTHSCWL